MKTENLGRPIIERTNVIRSNVLLGMISDVGNMKFSFYKVNPLIEISLGSKVNIM